MRQRATAGTTGQIQSAGQQNTATAYVAAPINAAEQSAISPAVGERLIGHVLAAMSLAFRPTAPAGET